MSKKAEKYRLFAMPVNAESVKLAQKSIFSRVTAWYVLVYTTDTSIDGAANIDGDDIERLSSADRDWLLACNMKLIAEDAKRREKEISQTIGEKIERLEKALEQAKNAAISK